MVTDVILSGLTNLFALFGARRNVDLKQSQKTLNDYLTRHFGIREVGTYLDLYKELRDFYGLAPDIDKDAIVEGVCKSMGSQLRTEDQALMLLRLMEFCSTTPDAFDPQDYVFLKTAKLFGVSDELYADFCCFVAGKESKNVTLQHYKGLDGTLKVLLLNEFNKLIVSYYGNDKVLMDDVPMLKGVYQTWTQSGVLKAKKTGLRIYYYTAMKVYGTSDDRNAITFCGRDINFRFPNSDNGMHDLSFDLHSGELLAIMGGSGTGKSTLLSLLNGTLTPQQGTITINGHDIREPEAKALIGFVPQDDLLIEELTVYKNLYYTARLCFEGMSEEELDRRVMKVLTELGLEQAKDLKVGSPLEKYISGGQRKRLNIALELIREPAVLFLDEPTSGLSSTDTEKVINILKELTHKGKLVVTNIHQPSSDVYKLFDRLWLLDKGGYPVFDGNPIEAVTYFKTAANYADADLSTCPTCGNVNPEVVLNIIDEKAFDESGQPTDQRKVSPEEWHKMYLDSRNTFPEAEQGDIPHTDQRKPGAFRQFCIFLRRTIATKVTNRQWLLITLLEAPALALICAFLTRYAPVGEDYCVMNNSSLVKYMFMAVIVATFIGMSGSAEEIIKDRTLLKREKFLSLSYASYTTSKIVFMAGVAMLQTFLFVLAGNLMMQLTDLFFTWWLVLFVAALVASLTGLLLSQCLNSVVAIYITIPILLIPEILLCGLVVDYQDLTPDSTTGDVPVVGDFIPSRWAFEALATTQFKDNAYECDLFESQKVKYETQYYRHAFLYEVQSQLETMEDERKTGKQVQPQHMDVIRKALPTIASVAQMPPYSGDFSYASLRHYTDDAEQKLSTLGNEATLNEDRILTLKRRSVGKEELLQMKRDYHNITLEDFVVHLNAEHTHDVVNGYIVPRVGFAFLTPQSTIGRAPFYSMVKCLGSKQISTLWFNLAMLLIMAIACATMLYCDFPGRYMRKKVN